MPTMPPTVLRMTVENENTPACQSIGTLPPIVEPTNTPSQMAFLFTGTTMRPGSVGPMPWVPSPRVPDVAGVGRRHDDGVIGRRGAGA